MRLVLFSDLHLDTPFRWAPQEVARQRRQALRDTLQNILRVADEVGADAILCGGDLYEHDRSTPDTAAFLREAFSSTPRPVYIAPGNHDWYAEDRSLYAQVDWPPNVHVFTADRLTAVELADGLTLWGAAHRAPANTDNFLDGFRVDRGGVHLALFHGSERGTLRFEGEGKEPHAAFDARQIREAGLHHALLGHYHTPRHTPHHTYPGNPDPLTFGEEGDRGAVITDIAADGTVTCRTRRVAVTDAHDVGVDVTGCASLQDVRDQVSKELAGKTGIARVTVQGELLPEVDLAPGDLDDVPHDLDAVVVRLGQVHVAYDIDAIQAEATVRGRFVQDVLADTTLDHAQRERILVTGLRALEGRDDLEVG